MKLEREEVAEKAKGFIADLLERIGLEAQLQVALEEEGVRIDIDSEDNEQLLSDNARLLYSVNHLVNQIFYRQSRDGCNFFLDCQNYRSDRAGELRLMAEKAAEKVKTLGTSISLQPMPASERRLIHLALAEQSGVRTQSEGTGRHRRVLIVPAG